MTWGRGGTKGGTQRGLKSSEIKADRGRKKRRGGVGGWGDGG